MDTNQNLGVLELLRLRGFPAEARAKFIRHQDKRYDVRELVRNGAFEAYQAIQSGPIYDNLDFAIVFLGDTGTRARFYGVYAVGGKERLQKGMLPIDCPFKEWENNENYYYTLQRDTRFDLFSDRIIIEWGSGTLSWHQHADKDKAVLELCPPGKLLAPFDDYFGFSISFQELLHITQHPDAHRDWRSRLSAVAGVYLILDTKTGNQYVGSACGKGGIWGRWSDYAQNGHGGNDALIDLVKDDPSYANNFRYSILQILPLSYTRSKVTTVEETYKKKLGSKATGLNC